MQKQKKTHDLESPQPNGEVLIGVGFVGLIIDKIWGMFQ